MGAPSPELCNLWLARAFNAQDVDAAAAMYHPDASIVQVDEVHGGSSIARGADGIRKTMAAYVGLKPHMDVVTHHTTVSGDFAMTRSQWLIKGTGEDGKPTEVHHHGMEVHRRLPDGSLGVFHGSPVRRRSELGGRSAATHRIVKSVILKPVQATRRIRQCKNSQRSPASSPRSASG